MVSLCQVVVSNMKGVPWQVVQVGVSVVVQVGVYMMVQVGVYMMVQVVRMVGGAMHCQQEGLSMVHHRSMGLKVVTVL